ncbi:hypothetical protein V1498_03205 [Peribacillus sp. SCS-26]|uniref:hypothetical protein n=1 Tax=Paraperibacillus marinus TaxID=3115295 RepID=UPI003905F8E0
MFIYSSPFWLGFLFVAVLLFVINFITQTYVMRVESFTTSRKSLIVLGMQSLVITILLNIF